MKTLRTFLTLLASISMNLGHADTPIILGGVEDSYSVGDVLYDSSFNKPGDWILQIQESDLETESKVNFDNGILDLYMPARGCTAWLKEKFHGPIAIVYRVRCPEETIDGDSIQARDINNFWHASDPGEDNLFDPERYTGDFGSERAPVN